MPGSAKATVDRAWRDRGLMDEMKTARDKICKERYGFTFWSWIKLRKVKRNTPEYDNVWWLAYIEVASIHGFVDVEIPVDLDRFSTFDLMAYNEDVMAINEKNNPKKPEPKPEPEIIPSGKSDDRRLTEGELNHISTLSNDCSYLEDFEWGDRMAGTNVSVKDAPSARAWRLKVAIEDDPGKFAAVAQRLLVDSGSGTEKSKAKVDLDGLHEKLDGILGEIKT